MIDGVFTICQDCGGEVSVQTHLVDAHMREGSDTPVHLVWSHVKCGVISETAISVQDYKSALSVLKEHRGAGGERVDSDGEVMLRTFAFQLNQVGSVDDIGAWKCS